jgi:long-subunit fatty acid transport protein
VGAVVFLATALAAIPRAARAGGFELPDNGTEALARGGAFVAKADDPTAIDYNPAGLAGQRGTRVLLDGHVVSSSYAFQRFGAYPDSPSNPSTPWGGFAFPKVHDAGGPFFAPFLAATTDFGTLDWLTVAVGVYGPSGVGNRTYPYGVEGAPSPARYDVVQATSSIILPTLSVGLRPLDWLDVGLSIHFVDALFDLTSTSFVDLGDGAQGPCTNYEYHPCDSLSSLHATGTSWAATPGILVRPNKHLTLGLSARTPISIEATGQATVLEAPLNQPIPPPGNVTLSTALPWYWRLGARYAFIDDTGFENGDVELDATYETWSQAQGTGPQIHIDHLGPAGAAFDNINITVAHDYNDTFSLRAGGAYRVKLPVGLLTVRAGAYYDKSATADNPGYTRLDMDTLDKIAGTVGVGFTWQGVSFNVAYADVFEPSRTVAPGTGQIRPIDGAQHGATVDASGSLLPAVNEGIYTGHTDIFSFSVVAVFDEILGTERSKRWSAPPAPASHAPPPSPRDTEPPPEPEARVEPKPEPVAAPPPPPDPDAEPEPRWPAKPTHRKAHSTQAHPAKAPARADAAPAPVPAAAAAPASPRPRSKKSDWDD